MSDGLRDWLGSVDSAQSRRIRELDEDLSYLRSSLSRQHRTAAALRSDLASLRGSIEMRLTRLSAAFDAFVELSSLRDQLSLVAGPALVRQATRARLVALGSPTGERGPVLDVTGVPSVPGYWLADALAALGTQDADAAERAAAADLRRTATFLTIAGAAGDRPELVTRWAFDALGTLDPDRPVDRAQRALWVAAAQGRLGVDARAAVLQRLGDVVASLPDDVVDRTLEEWTDQLRDAAGYVRPAARAAHDAAPQLPQARRAAGALARLRTLTTATTPTPHQPYGSPTDGDLTLDALVSVLRALVDEGTEEERALMHRVAELEALVTGQSAPEPAWDAPAGDLLDLLRTDALERTDEVGAVARTACTPWLRRITRTLVWEADVAAPSHVGGRAVGVMLRARASGGVEGLDEALAAARTRRHPPTSGETWAAVGLAVGAALLSAGAFALPHLAGLLWLAAGVCAATTVTLVVRQARRMREESARIARDVAFVESEARRLRSSLVDVTRRLEACREEAREHHVHLSAAWGDHETTARAAGASRIAPPAAARATGAPDAGAARVDAPPPGTDAARPDDAQATRPEDADATALHDADATQPHDADATQPHDADATQPHDADASQPHDADASPAGPAVTDTARPADDAAPVGAVTDR